MPQRGLSTRSKNLAALQTRGTATLLYPAAEAEEHAALQEECHRLHLLVGELLLKNHELRSEVARLRSDRTLELLSEAIASDFGAKR